MNFDFSEDEKLVRDQTARYLGDNCGLGVVRAVLDGEANHAEQVWRGLVDMGLTGTCIPEAQGGVDAGYLTLCLVAEQLGAHLAPTPFSSSVYLATEALMQFGTADQQQQWLPKLGDGSVIGTLAVTESVQELTAQTVTVEATGDSAGGTNLSGCKLIVPDGDIADVAAVLAKGVDGLGLYWVDLRDASVARSTVTTVDPTRNSASLTFAETPATALGAPGKGWEQLQRLQDRAAVLFSFEQLGGAQRALDMAVNYAQERFAFGRPIGSFQALKHMMADMYVALKLAESNCYYAAWALASDSPDLPLAAATARISATEAFQLCASDNIQVHGGMGFTWEFDCHMYYRRSNYLALQLGGVGTWENKLVDALPLAVA